MSRAKRNRPKVLSAAATLQAAQSRAFYATLDQGGGAHQKPEDRAPQLDETTELLKKAGHGLNEHGQAKG